MKTKTPDALLAAEVSRRGLMKTTAIGGLAMASSAFTLPFTRIAQAADNLNPVSETLTWSACTVNCGSRCPLRMHVCQRKKIFFSRSLINYTRQKWLARDFNNSISSDDWWLMEEIFKGKSLSQISSEQKIDVRRLSRCKRGLMKKLNVKNNVELFNIFKCIVATPCV